MDILFKKSKVAGLTQFKCFQIIEDVNDPFEIKSIDYFASFGIPGRLTGVVMSSEVTLFHALRPLVTDTQQVRFYSIHIEGGDVQPSPRNEEEVLKKKVLSLDSNCSPFLRKYFGYRFGIGTDRKVFLQAISDNPAIVNRIWQEDMCAHLHAIQWIGTITLNGAKESLPNIRLLTIRDCALIKNVHCLTSPSAAIAAQACIPYPAEQSV